MFNKIIQKYNQLKDDVTKNGCSLYSLFNILQLNWGIMVDNSFIIKTAIQAETDWVYDRKWGAYYATIYQYFCDKILERTDVVVKIKALDIRSEDFKKLNEAWYAFGIWPRYWWRFWRQAKEDWIIDENDIWEFDWWAELWHALTFHKWYILDSLWWKLLKCDYDTLVRMVNMGIFRTTARTLYLEDRLLDKYLKSYQKWERILNVELLPEADRFAIERASKLRVFKK